MFSSTPVASIVTSRAEPPKEMKGSGSPFVGSMPVTTPRFTSVWVAMSTVMVRDSGGPKRGVVNAAFLDARPALDPFLIELQERTFRFFWDTGNPKNGLIPDRYPTPSFSSIAAVGFGLTTYPIGVERGYVTREAARQRVLATLRFFRDAPQGST